jgi:hypothetical protein
LYFSTYCVSISNQEKPFSKTLTIWGLEAGVGAEATRKWRRNQLKRLDCDSEIARALGPRLRRGSAMMEKEKVQG